MLLLGSSRGTGVLGTDDGPASPISGYCVGARLYRPPTMDVNIVFHGDARGSFNLVASLPEPSADGDA